MGTTIITNVVNDGVKIQIAFTAFPSDWSVREEVSVEQRGSCSDVGDLRLIYV